MAIQLQPTETSIWRIVQAIIQLVEGRHNASGRIALVAGATTTVVPAPNCGKDSEPQISPRTANAAAAVPTTYISLVEKGSFTITHANNGQMDRIFGWTTTGG